MAAQPLLSHDVEVGNFKEITHLSMVMKEKGLFFPSIRCVLLPIARHSKHMRGVRLGFLRRRSSLAGRRPDASLVVGP